MARRLSGGVVNGIYSIDMEADDFIATMSPADIAEAVRYFKNASKTDVVRGVGFGAGMVPENPVSYPQLPVGVIDATYDDLDEIEVVKFGRNGFFYFLQTVDTQKAYALADLKANLAEKKPKKLDEFKGITPEMRVVYSLLLAEKKKKEVAEPVVALRLMMEESGANVRQVKVTNRGYEVAWGFDKYHFVTMYDKEMKVVHAGYCVRNLDKLLSARSIVTVLKEGIAKHGDDGMIHPTIAYDMEDLDRDPDDD